MTDYLELPPFLDLRIPAVLAEWKEARRHWRPSKAKRIKEATPNRDAEGRALPREMSPEAWALLRAQEKDAARRKAERFAALKASKA